MLPVTEALDALSRLHGGKTLGTAMEQVPAYARVEAGRLLPQLSPAGEPAEARAGGWQRGRLFAGLAELLAALARPDGLILVVEDVHWADSATLDFLTFLTRAARAEAVSVVATCRSDEAHLEPQVAAWLAHVRGGDVAEIRLGALSRGEMAEQAARLAGEPVPEEFADALYARGEGNPFFTEQLVAHATFGAAGGPAGLPGRLAQLLAARARDRGDDARAVLAALAIAARPLTEDQLSQVAGLGTDALRAALRELADARLLADDTADGVCRVRHALLAEAVTDGLLPGERHDLHERTAQMLEAAGDGALAAEAADHWAAVGRADAELKARVRAAAAAERVFGYAEAAAQWQRAIALRQAAPETGDAPGLAELFIHAIDALHVSGEAERAGALAEEAYRKCAGQPDPAIDAVIHERAARFRGLGDVWLGGQDTPGSGLPLIAEALRLFDQAPPSAEHAEALFYYGNFLSFGQGRDADSRQALDRGLQVAEAARATGQIPRILAMIPHHLLLEGRVDEALAMLRRGRELAEQTGDAEARILLDGNESDLLSKLARFTDALGVAQRGLDAARQVGLAAYWTAAVLYVNAAGALLSLGRTDDAAAIIDPLTGGPPGRDHWIIHSQRAEIDMLRGEMAAAQRRQRQLSELVAGVGNLDWSRDAGQRAAELEVWAGQPGRALGEVRRVTTLLEGSSWAIYCGRLLVVGMQACADLAESARARRDETAARAAQAASDELAASAPQLAAAAFTDHPSFAAIPAERATWAAEHSRLAGSPDPSVWQAAAVAWADLGWPHRAAYAWWRRAEAQLNTGEARDAAASLRSAAGAAQGHVPLLSEIRKLAGRARIPLESTPASPARVPEHAGRPYGLTGRELSVLRLLATGRTNAQIGAELFISSKTASVHVTSIFRKLGVAGRVQAAAVAERAGLLDSGPP